ncbi:growth-regulating factor 10-like [Euphorbia lathyris]|uniref:growth-regulating factor 10-like n=1 Tax=Euphorbia lathyris TaxID=212925 RepID=UPI0033132913
METNFAPSKLARFAHSSPGCLRMKRNGSPPIGLGLALGIGGSTDKEKASSGAKSYGFTILQRQELQLQTAIYRYIEARSPVPYHLILPIWRCVSTSFGTLNSNIFCPTFMRGMQMENRNGIELEPGRCRRTDGKKWRCSKEAVADQKYCERHMHRGRQRTRKLMEVAAKMNNSNASTTNCNLSISLSLATPTPAPAKSVF